MAKIRVGDRVRMTREFCATLSREDSRHEVRRRYTVADIRYYSDGTGLVDFVRRGRQQCHGAALRWVERV